MELLAEACIRFWWLEGPEEERHERESALRLRRFNNHNLPFMASEQAAIAAARQRKAVREFEVPRRPSTRALLLDNHETRKLFFQRVGSGVRAVREDIQRMSVTSHNIVLAARNLWIRRYEYVRGYPQPNDITFLGWRSLYTRRDIEHGREADPATWRARVKKPKPDASDVEGPSGDEAYDSEGADAMLYADPRRSLDGRTAHCLPSMPRAPSCASIVSRRLSCRSPRRTGHDVSAPRMCSQWKSNRPQRRWTRLRAMGRRQRSRRTTLCPRPYPSLPRRLRPHEALPLHPSTTLPLADPATLRHASKVCTLEVRPKGRPGPRRTRMGSSMGSQELTSS